MTIHSRLRPTLYLLCVARCGIQFRAIWTRMLAILLIVLPCVSSSCQISCGCDKQAQHSGATSALRQTGPGTGQTDSGHCSKKSSRQNHRSSCFAFDLAAICQRAAPGHQPASLGEQRRGADPAALDRGAAWPVDALFSPTSRARLSPGQERSPRLSSVASLQTILRV